MTSLSDTNKRDSKHILEPQARMKQLVELSHDITVDKNILISRYFNSGRELIKSAASFEEKGLIEKAFVLYLRYMTLFLEKIIHHPDYSKADRNEKALVKNECNNVIELAEGLKKRILEKYTKEYEAFLSSGGNATVNQVQKRSVDSQGSSFNRCDIEEIDRRFDFSQKPSDEDEEKCFDPFNIGQLKQSFNDSKD